MNGYHNIFQIEMHKTPVKIFNSLFISYNYNIYED